MKHKIQTRLHFATNTIRISFVSPLFNRDCFAIHSQHITIQLESLRGFTLQQKNAQAYSLIGQLDALKAIFMSAPRIIIDKTSAREKGTDRLMLALMSMATCCKNTPDLPHMAMCCANMKTKHRSVSRLKAKFERKSIDDASCDYLLHVCTFMCEFLFRNRNLRRQNRNATMLSL